MNISQVFWDIYSRTVKMARITDIIDIFIVAFVIYKGIKLVRETRAEQLVKGILFLLIGMQVAEWLQLNAINFILRNTMQVGVLALLVVFQPELRRALEQVGRSSFGNFLHFENADNSAKTSDSITEICVAVDALSKDRTGALVVIERETKIGDIIRTGTTLDAKVSSELLLNIFYPRSPLHDGAVVIRENRIMAANCFLPLTQDTSLSKELGTRHRAAIGISENCDAVVVVVSEESGKISIAVNGDLTRNLTVENLNRALIKIFMPTPQDRAETNFIIKKVKSRWKNG